MNNPLRGGELQHVGHTQIGSDVKGTARHDDVVWLYEYLLFSKTRPIHFMNIIGYFFLLVCVVMLLFL